MRKTKKASITPVKGYTVHDRRGTKQANLYSQPQHAPQNYRPRFYSMATDTKKAYNATDRESSLKYGRSLFATLPDLGGALMSKASWAVGPSSFTPIFTGKDQEWGNAAEQWLQNSFYPVCNVQGSNFDFRTTLSLTSLALDVDGDNLLILTNSRDGFPLVQVVPSHRIGNRYMDTEVKTGKYKGLQIIDGVIINGFGRPIAYRILGDTPDEDYDISAQSCQLLFEPEWSDQYRGISRVARPLTDFMDQQDIDEFLKRGVKLASSLGIIHSTESGTPDTSANLVGVDDTDLITGAPSSPPLEIISGGEIMYLKANAGEKIESLKDERPSQNTQEFITRIQRRALFACGWPIELLDPSKVGGAAVRLIQDLARKTVSSRQVTLEKRAKLIVNYAIARAMNQGYLPQNNDDWYSWSFTKGSAICVDNGNESQADREGYKLGTTSLSEISSKKGLDWQELRMQAQKETEDLLDRAQVISKKYGITMDAALALLSQRTPNQAPVMGEPAGQTTP